MPNYVDGSCTSSHENKTFGSRSVVKQKGMLFGFRKTATAVTRPERQIAVITVTMLLMMSVNIARNM